MVWVQFIRGKNLFRKYKLYYTSTCIAFIGFFREEDESEEDEEMENQENGDTDAKKTVEGTAQDFPMARCASISKDVSIIIVMTFKH